MDKDHAYPLSQRNGTQTPQSSGPHSLFMSDVGDSRRHTPATQGKATDLFLRWPANAYCASQADRAWLERAAEPLHRRGIDPELGRRLAHAQSARTSVQD